MYSATSLPVCLRGGGREPPATAPSRVGHGAPGVHTSSPPPHRRLPAPARRWARGLSTRGGAGGGGCGSAHGGSGPGVRVDRVVGHGLVAGVSIVGPLPLVGGHDRAVRGSRPRPGGSVGVGASALLVLRRQPGDLEVL